MAKLASNLSFTGSLGNLSAYKMRGVEGTVVRIKGGATKKKIKEPPVFERTRELNAEFGGRATGSKWMMQAMWPQKALADFNPKTPACWKGFRSTKRMGLIPRCAIRFRVMRYPPPSTFLPFCRASISLARINTPCTASWRHWV